LTIKFTQHTGAACGRQLLAFGLNQPETPANPMGHRLIAIELHAQSHQPT